MSRPAVVLKSYRYPLWVRELQSDWPLILILVGSLVLSIVPIVFMVFISFKDMGQFLTNPLGISLPIHYENYRVAFAVLWRPFLNSVAIAIVTILGTLVVSSLAAYVFARFRFVGREPLYWLVIVVLFIPGILTFTTRFVLVANYGLLDTYAAVIIPSIATNQVFQIFVLRSFFAALPEEILEAARVSSGTSCCHCRGR